MGFDQADRLPELRVGFLRMERIYTLDDLVERVLPYLPESTKSEVEHDRNAFAWREERGADTTIDSQWEFARRTDAEIVNRVFIDHRAGATYATVVSPDVSVVWRVQDALKRWMSADLLEFRETPSSLARLLTERQIRYAREMNDAPPRLGVTGIEVERGAINHILETSHFFEDFVEYIDGLLSDFPRLDEGRVRTFYCAVGDAGIFYECARFDDGTGAVFANDDLAVQRIVSALSFLFDFEYAY